MTILSISQHASVPVSLTEINVMATLQLWMDRHKQRKQLAGLEDYQLDDIGLTRAAMLTEVNRPFWK